MIHSPPILLRGSGNCYSRLSIGETVNEVLTGHSWVCPGSVYELASYFRGTLMLNPGVWIGLRSSDVR